MGDAGSLGLVRGGSRRSKHVFFFSSRRRHTRLQGDWSSDVCSSDLTALDGLCRSAGNAVREGARIVILSDRAAGRERAPLPMLLAVGAVHQHLLEHGLRTRLGLIAEAGDAWDVHHFAALIGYGEVGVHPW